MLNIEKILLDYHKDCPDNDCRHFAEIGDLCNEYTRSEQFQVQLRNFVLCNDASYISMKSFLEVLVVNAVCAGVAYGQRLSEIELLERINAKSIL